MSVTLSKDSSTIPSGHADPYAQSAEFYEVMALPHWEPKRAVLLSALSDAGQITEPIVDIGSGTGLSTMAVAESVPAVPIHAVEPSPAMRAVLMSRIISREDVTNRVTVHAETAEQFALPDRIGAAVLYGVIGFLDPQARQRFWENLRPRLTPQAPVLVEVMALEQPMEVPELMIAQQQVGNRRNEILISGQPAGPDAELWTMRYVVREDDAVVREVTSNYTWRTVGLAELAREAEAHDMTFQQVHPLIGLLHAR